MEPRQTPCLQTNPGFSFLPVDALPRWLRQQLLQETRHFTCACTRCAEDIAPSTDRLLEVHPPSRPMPLRGCDAGCAVPRFQVSGSAGRGVGRIGEQSQVELSRVSQDLRRRQEPAQPRASRGHSSRPGARKRKPWLPLLPRPPPSPSRPSPGRSQGTALRRRGRRCVAVRRVGPGEGGQGWRGIRSGFGRGPGPREPRPGDGGLLAAPTPQSHPLARAPRQDVRR